MRSIKRLILLGSMIGALVALAAPAIASAELTSGGIPVAPGEVFHAESTNFKKTDSLGTRMCESFSFDSEVTENEGSTFADVGVGEGKASVCKLGTTSVIVRNIKLSSLISTKTGTGTIVFSFEEVLPGRTCKYVSSGSGTAVSWTPPSGSIHISGALTASPAACGTMSISGDFALSQPGSPAGGLILD